MKDFLIKAAKNLSACQKQSHLNFIIEFEVSKNRNLRGLANLLFLGIMEIKSHASATCSGSNFKSLIKLYAK